MISLLSWIQKYLAIIWRERLNGTIISFALLHSFIANNFQVQILRNNSFKYVLQVLFSRTPWIIYFTYNRARIIFFNRLNCTCSILLRLGCHFCMKDASYSSKINIWFHLTSNNSKEVTVIVAFWCCGILSGGRKFWRRATGDRFLAFAHTLYYVYYCVDQFIRYILLIMSVTQYLHSYFWVPVPPPSEDGAPDSMYDEYIWVMIVGAKWSVRWYVGFHPLNTHGKPTICWENSGKSWERFVATCVLLGWASSWCWRVGSRGAYSRASRTCRSQVSPNPAQRTLNWREDRRLRLPWWVIMDLTMNSCSLCWATVNGEVYAGS